MLRFAPLLFVLCATQDPPQKAPKPPPSAAKELELKEKALAAKPVE